MPLGLKAVVIGNFGTTLISFFINTYYPGKMFGYGAIRQIKEMKTVAIATLIMAVSVFGITHVLPGDFIKLLAGSVLGIVTYLLSAYFMKIEELNEVKKMAMQMMEKIKVRN